MASSLNVKAEDLVWIPDETTVWKKATVLSQSGTTLTVKDQLNGQTEIDLQRTETYDPDHDKDWNNAFSMGDLNEAGLLHLLEQRMAKETIYTFLGDVLLSVNPYRDISGLYEPMPKSADLKSKEPTAKPHLYVLADRAYHAIFDVDVRRASQSILISGESGAGKTEAAKHVMGYLANLSSERRKELAAKAGNAAATRLGAKAANVNIFAKKGRGKKGAARSTVFGGKSSRGKSLIGGEQLATKDRTVTSLEKVILSTNSMIEAFGNAVTLRNDNSSRFGKFVKLEYDEDGVICGAQTRHFLLEKSRIVKQGANESNYHSFYLLCAAVKNDPNNEMFAHINGLLKLKQQYRYLNEDFDPNFTPEKPRRKTNETFYKGVSALLDKDQDRVNHKTEQPKPESPKDQALVQAFWQTCDGLSSIDASLAEQQDVWRVVACVLALGNINFEDNPKAQGCIVSIKSQEALQDAAHLLGVDVRLLELSLCKRTVRAAQRASFQHVPLTTVEAGKSRDGLAKAIYEALFEWMLNKVNTATRYSIRNLSNAKKQRKQALFIGILDIFGFEIFDSNSFEQLCINFANESLQNMFDDHVKLLEKEEYEAEGIPFRNIQFRDNKPLLKMMNNKGDGIFQLIDEQGALGKRGSDDRLLRAIQSIHGELNKNPYFLGVSKSDKNVFIIQHFAGPVEYSVLGMVEKNADHLQPDLAELIIEGAPVTPAPVAKPRRNTFRPMSSIINRPHGHEKAGGAQQPKGFLFLQAAMTLREKGGGSSSKFDERQTVVARKRGNTTLKPGDSYAKKMAQLVTISGRFRSQMKALERLLKQTKQHYVRCIKPNESKIGAGSPGSWEPKRVVAQLGMLGALQMADVRRQGYPVRSSFSEVLKKYARLVVSKEVEWTPNDNDRQACAELLNIMYPGEKGDAFVMGESKCFMKEKTQKELEAAERALEGEIVLEGAKAAISTETMRNLERPQEELLSGAQALKEV